MLQRLRSLPWIGLSVSVVLMACISLMGLNSSALAQGTDASSYPDLPRLEGEATVELMVNDAPITLEIKGNEAPITAGNFVELVADGFYDNLVFHRVVRQPRPFVVQGGDPQSLDPSVPAQLLGTGGYIDPNTSVERTIPLEILPEGADTPVYGRTFDRARISTDPVLFHKRGAVAMARSQDPDSGSSQFYITLADQGFLDGKYAVFGYVTDGMEAVDRILQGDRIQTARVTQGIENLVRPENS